MRDMERDGRDFAEARVQLTRRLGARQVRALHEPDRLRAVLHVVGVFVAIGVNAWILATASSWLVWLPVLLLQGFCLQCLGYLMHEFGVHRGLQSPRLSDAFGTALGPGLFTSYTAYRLVHTAHHRHTGAAWDEGYKQGIDTRPKRLLNLTGFGTLYFMQRPPIEPSPAEARRICWENRASIAFALGLAAGLYFFPRLVGYGYLLPFVLTLPLASNLRLILEHGEANPENDFHSGTYYRTGLLTQLLFFWDAGDCHLVHHLYPGIQSYHMAEATRALRPLLVELGVNERRSLLQLLQLWFVKGLPHRSHWAEREEKAPVPVPA